MLAYQHFESSIANPANHVKGHAVPAGFFTVMLAVRVVNRDCDNLDQPEIV